jgi:hypothetical protein
MVLTPDVTAFLSRLVQAPVCGDLGIVALFRLVPERATWTLDWTGPSPTTPYDYFLRAANAVMPSLAIELIPSPVASPDDTGSRGVASGPVALALR